MKSNDKNNPKNAMVARQEPRRNTFIVTKTDGPHISDADNLLKEVTEEENELAAVEQGLTERRQQLAEKRNTVADAVRKEKLDTRAALLSDAADWREIARTSDDADRAKDFLRKAKDAEREAAQLGVDLNLIDDPQTIPKPTPVKLLSTTRAIQVIVGLFFGFVLLTYIYSLFQPSDNSMGQSILSNAPIRALLSFTLTFLSFLVGVFFLSIAYPQFYRIWNNTIETERNMDTLISESPAWVVLACLLGLIYGFMWLFASFYQSMYA